MSDKIRPLILVGVRGNFADIISVTKDLGIPIKGILDKYYYRNTDQVSGIPIIGSEDQLINDTDIQAQEWKQQCDFFVSSWWTGSQHLNDIGLNNEQLRLDRIDLVEKSGVNVISLISPDVQYLPGTNLKFGKGILVLGYVGLNDNVTIGDYSVVEWQAALSHDTHLGKNVLVGVRAIMSGVVVEDNVRIGPASYLIGGQSNSKTSIRIGKGTTVWTGAGSFKDVPPDSMLVPPLCKVLSKQRTLDE